MSKPLPLPYSDSFDKGTQGQQARYLANMEGAFTVEPCADRDGKCVQLDTPTKPLEWSNRPNSYPYTVLGGQAWSNYQVSADVRNAQPGSVGILGREHNLDPDPTKVNFYSLTLGDTGAWSINLRSGSGNVKSLVSGTVASAAGLNTWHNLALTFDGSLIYASVDGTTVGSVTDATHSMRQGRSRRQRLPGRRAVRQRDGQRPDRSGRSGGTAGEACTAREW